jgi:hypothetical protein
VELRSKNLVEKRNINGFLRTIRDSIKVGSRISSGGETVIIHGKKMTGGSCHFTISDLHFNYQDDVYNHIVVLLFIVPAIQHYKYTNNIFHTKFYCFK